MKYVVIVGGILLALYINAEHVPTPQKPTEDTEKRASLPYPVVSVIDGDTVIVETEAGEERIRLLGIDTPEVNPRRGEPECFAHEATTRTRELLTDQTVTLEFDASQGRYDTHGRLLAFIRLSDGRLLNEMLIAEGYAREYTHSKPYQYQKVFQAAEEQAKNQAIGLWGKCQNDS